ncbi:MAG: hypothetical protein E7180_05660 [Erysipelotrichaceae bacterium]|nr:hypothetical protein [Erysipelotrichaceae bacterium]
MKLRKTLAGILGAVVMLLGVGTFEHVNKETGVHAADGTYEKATSIAVGDTVLLVCDSKNMELSGISTSSTKYGLGTAYTGVPAGAYQLTVEAGSTSGTYAFKNSDDKYLYWTSGNSLNVNGTLDAKTSWNVTFSDGNATIKNSNDNTRIIRWNASSPRFACYTSGQTDVQLYKYVLNDCTHPTTTTTTKDPTCTENGSVIETCTNCGAVVSASDIDATGHNFENGVCKNDCGLDAISNVKKLFDKYYNDNQYLKETILNTTDMADEEVETYFHASASVKERETWYYGDTENGTSSLTMYTNEDTNGDGTEENVVSTYENKDGKVYHTGKGGNWSVNWNSVEEKFVTLKDFKDSTDTDKNWICDDDKKVFTYNLTPATANSEHEMTRMAREFIAPMWLAPNADNYNYVRFSKLTVEDKSGVGLVMKLYVHSGDIDGKVTDENGVFAQATINSVYNVEINIEGNGTVVEENRLIAGNHTAEYTLNIPEGYRVSSAAAEKATIGTTTEGFALSEANGNVEVNIVVEEKTNDPITETLSFETTASRQSLTEEKQVWVNGGITFTNNKANSSSVVADYSNPIRLYKNSEIVIEANQMTKIVINSNGTSSYKTALGTSLDNAGVSYTNDGSAYTIEFKTAVDSFTLVLSGGQARFVSIDVTYVAA